jgi:hypothetical protein
MNISLMQDDLARSGDQLLFENSSKSSQLAVGDAFAMGTEAIRTASTTLTQKSPRWPKKALGHLGHLGRHGRLARSRLK